MKTYICPRCQPRSRKKPLPFGDALSFSNQNDDGFQAPHKDDGDDIQVDETKIDWKVLGEVVYCGDGDVQDDVQLDDDPSGFIFVAYASFADIAKERSEAHKTRQAYAKKQQRLQEMIHSEQQSCQQQQPPPAAP